MSTDQNQTPPKDEQLEPEASVAEQAAEPAEQPNATETAAEAPQPSADEAELDEIEQLKITLEQVRGEAADQVLRAQAEAQNSRRRAEKDVENARRYALEKFSADLLPIVDNLERALQAGSDDDGPIKAVLEGVELTHKSFMDVLGKYNIEQLNPVSEPFDPQYHEAITMVPNPNLEPNTVMDVVQKGYTLNGRLIRAAMVVVSQAG